MRYRVAFTKRYQSDGTESAQDPTAELDVYLAEGVVAEKVFVERLEPAAQHNQEVLDEDDAWLGMAAPEVWEYEVVNSRQGEFEDAIRNSQTVMEFEIIDAGDTGPDEATAVALAEPPANAPESRELPEDDVSRTGSGVRGVDDGPAGQVTGNPAAGGMRAAGDPRYGLDQVEGISSEGGAGIDDLTVTDASDPRLGLTNIGDKPPEDWAANTGLTRTPDRGIESDRLGDDASTLAPDKPRAKRPRKRAKKSA